MTKVYNYYVIFFPWKNQQSLYNAIQQYHNNNNNMYVYYVGVKAWAQIFKFPLPLHPPPRLPIGGVGTLFNLM